MKEVNIFCDEIKDSKLKLESTKNQKWSYIGMLIVPSEMKEKLLTKLKDKRCGHPNKNPTWASCQPLCPHHEDNDKEVHYKELHTADKYHIGKRWLDFLLEEDRELIHFYILGINLIRLDKSFFGKEKPHDRPFRIYNRFFRTAIQKSLKSFFYKQDKIKIESIYHDEGDGLENHTFFPWHSIFKLDSEDSKLEFNCNEIEFIKSDHKESGNDLSNFIQLIDLILGASHNALHYNSKNEKKEKIAKKIYPLLHRLINEPKNKHSRYNYFGRMAIDFFPKYSLKGVDPDSLEYKKKRYDSFYKKRPLLIKNKDQLSLF